MAYDKPIACSLGADDRTRRMAEIRAIGRDALLGVDAAGVLRFRNDAAIRTKLERLIAAESVCCAFLEFELRAAGEQLELRITAPEGAEPLALDLVDAFGSSARA